MITKPEDLKFDEKKFFMIIAGVPGIGKTTLALSAPKPLLIDLDNGIGRVETVYRKDTDVVKSFDELVNDLKDNDLSNYETIVVDTGGKLFEMMKPVVIREDAKNGKRDGNLSLPGYGAIKKKFIDFVKYVKSLGKHLIIVFHASEVSLPNDITGLRIRLEGSSKDDVWDDVDIGGFVEMVGNERTISFNNCERFYAKGTHGVHGVYTIPTLKNGSPNNFVEKLFNKMIEQLNEESALLTQYKALIAKYDSLIDNAKNVSDLGSLLAQLASCEHVFTSKEELWSKLNNKAKELGCSYDKSKQTFIDNSKPTK